MEMRRRDFISLVGGTLAASPLQVRAQQSERMRRIAMLTPRAENDPEGQGLVAAFREALEKLGWTDGRNIRIETRWGVADANSIQRVATELVALQPDVILTNSTPAVRAFQQATGALPIVFVAIADPVRTGVVLSLAHPGGNITGFTNFEASMGSKWLELLKEIAPRTTRVALIFNPDTHSGQFFQLLEAAGPSIGIEPVQTPVHNAAEIERALASFSGEANAGLVAMPDIFTTVHSDLIISLATKYRLPAVSWIRSFAAGGGLMSYGIDPFDLYRRAASYVDRILKGGKPADLPVQQPTKFDFVINLKTAKALGLTVPPSLLAAADEVIE
jgi:putative tryptophan/tyrosine transport system substrate-binding protein